LGVNSPIIPPGGKNLWQQGGYPRGKGARVSLGLPQRGEWGAKIKSERWSQSGWWSPGEYLGEGEIFWGEFFSPGGLQSFLKGGAPFKRGGGKGFGEKKKKGGPGGKI